MSYSLPADVGILLQITFDADSSPTQVQVQSIIDQVDSEINLQLKGIGITASAVTDADQLNFLKTLSSYGSACRVGFVYFGNANPVEGTQASYYCEQYKEWMDDTDTLGIWFGGGETAEDITVENQVTDGTTTESAINDMQISNEYKV